MVGVWRSFYVDSESLLYVNPRFTTVLALINSVFLRLFSVFRSSPGKHDPTRVHTQCGHLILTVVLLFFNLRT